MKRIFAPALLLFALTANAASAVSNPSAVLGEFAPADDMQPLAQMIVEKPDQLELLVDNDQAEPELPSWLHKILVNADRV